MVDVAGRRFNGTCAAITYDTQELISGVLLAQDGSPRSSITVNFDDQTVVRVGEETTVLNGRPLVIVLRDGFIIISRARLPDHAREARDFQRWCQETIDRVTSKSLLDLLADMAGNDAVHAEDGIERIPSEYPIAVPGDG